MSSFKSTLTVGHRVPNALANVDAVDFPGGDSCVGAAELTSADEGGGGHTSEPSGTDICAN